MATKNTLLKKITSGRSTNPTTELAVSQPVEYVYDLCFYTFVCFYSNIMSSSKKKCTYTIWNVSFYYRQNDIDFIKDLYYYHMKQWVIYYFLKHM